VHGKLVFAAAQFVHKTTRIFLVESENFGVFKKNVHDSAVKANILNEFTGNEQFKDVMTFPTKPKKLAFHTNLPEVLPVPARENVVLGHFFFAALRATI
jgi:hypothetical protein